MDRDDAHPDNTNTPNRDSGQQRNIVERFLADLFQNRFLVNADSDTAPPISPQPRQSNRLVPLFNKRGDSGNYTFDLSSRPNAARGGCHLLRRG
jgi:hypothetical protein